MLTQDHLDALREQLSPLLERSGRSFILTPFIVDFEEFFPSEGETLKAPVGWMFLFLCRYARLDRGELSSRDQLFKAQEFVEGSDTAWFQGE